MQMFSPYRLWPHLNLPLIELSELNLQFKYCNQPHAAGIFATAAVCKRWNISSSSPSGLQMDKS